MTIKQFFLFVVPLSITLYSPLFSSDDDDANSYEFCADTKKKPSKQRAFLRQERCHADFFSDSPPPRLNIFAEISGDGQFCSGTFFCEDLEHTLLEGAKSPHHQDQSISFNNEISSEENVLNTNGKNSDESDEQPFDPFDEKYYLGSLLDSSPGIDATPPSSKKLDDDGDESFFSQPPFFAQQESSSSLIHSSNQTPSFFEDTDEFLHEDPLLSQSNDILTSSCQTSAKPKKKRPIHWDKLLKRARAYKKNYDALITSVFTYTTLKNLAFSISQTPSIWHHSLKKKMYTKLSKYSKKSGDIHAVFALIFCGEKFLKQPVHKDQRSILARFIKKHQKKDSSIETHFAQAKLLTMHHFSTPTQKHFALAQEKWIFCIGQLQQHAELSSDYLDYAHYQLAHLITYAPNLCTASDLENALSTLYTFAFSGNHYALFSLGLACFDPYLKDVIQSQFWPKTHQREHYLRGLRFLQAALQVESNYTSWFQTAYERTRATLGDERAAFLFMPKNDHHPLIIKMSGNTLHRFYV